ncbi:MAG: GNAT family N-acetyltransferase [Candidatus Bipolaricaulia bacterium]
MQVTIREITEDNFIEAIRLEPKPEQKQFVASNAASIAQSKFHTFLHCCGIYDGDTMVGFSAFGKNPEDDTIWIVRHMIGAEHQRKGYGRAGLRVLLDHMKRESDCASIFLDVGPENVAAIKLYESAGFVDTGKIQGKSKVYWRDPG